MKKKVFPFWVGPKILAEVQSVGQGKRAEYVIQAVERFAKAGAVQMFHEKKVKTVSICFDGKHWLRVLEVAKELNCNLTDIVRGAFIPKGEK